MCIHKLHGVSRLRLCSRALYTFMYIYMYIFCVVTDFSQLLQRLQNACLAELCYSPYENTLGRVKCVFHHSPTSAPPLPPTPVLGGGLGPLSGLGQHWCARLRLVGAMSCPKCSTMRPRRPKVPKGTAKAHFWTSLGDPFGATLRKWRPCENLIIYYVFMTKNHSGNARCRTVDRVGHRVRSRSRFSVSLGGHRCAQASPKVAIGRPR